MKKPTTEFTVLMRLLAPARGDNYAATMVPMMTLNAPNAATALQIAKRKGVINPIIGVKNV